MAVLLKCEKNMPHEQPQVHVQPGYKKGIELLTDPQRGYLLTVQNSFWRL